MSDNPDQTPHERRRPDGSETRARGAARDLFVWVKGEDEYHEKPVTDADLARLGYVQAPECDTCGGWRVGCMHEGRFSPQHCADAKVACPTCDGSGFKRLVALDGIDVEALKLLARGGWSVKASEVVRQVLAALDGESCDCSDHPDYRSGEDWHVDGCDR